MKKDKSLKKEILTLLIFFSIIITICTGLISLSNSYYSKLDVIKYNQKQILNQVESEVNKYLFKISTLSKYLKNNYTIEKGNLLLKNIVDTNSNISSILVLDKKGVIRDFYAPTNLNIYKGFDYSKKDYFKYIDNKRDDYWSNVFLSSIDEKSSLSYSFRSDGYVIVLMVKLQELSEFISRLKNQDGSHIIRILDSSGIVIINQDKPNFVLQRISVKNSDVYKSMIEKIEPYEFTKFESINKQQIQYASYTNIKKTGWIIISRESYSLILNSLNNIIYGTFFTILGFILLSIAISLKISRRIFSSFDDLQSTTNSIANGDYSIELKKSYYEEFNKLLKSFNKMKIEIDKREDDLESSLESFKSLVNLTMEAIIIHKKGVCIDVNDVAIKLFGYKTKNEMIGKEYISFVSEKSKKLVNSRLKKETDAYEVEYIKKDGDFFIALSQGRFIELLGEEVKVSTLIDITDIKHKDKLLFQQSKMASMGEMIGNIAHQWRQPLSAISSAASGMKLQKEYGLLKEEDFFEAIDAIVNSTQYLSKTIDDFRNFFKMDKSTKLFSIQKAIENILSLISATLKNNEIEVITTFENDYEVMGYENELTQAIINILNNAKDALLLNKNEDGKRLIIISLNKIEKDVIQISIKDSGGGIKEEVLPSIFEPYFTTKYNQQGTGIGLYMTHQIIVLHMNGKIKAKNSVFKHDDKTYTGANFLIDLKINQNNT